MEPTTPTTTPLPAIEAHIQAGNAQKTKTKRNLFITIGVLSIALIFSIWVFSHKLSEKNTKLNQLDSTLSVANGTINELAYRLDYAVRSIEYLSNYRNLTNAMSYRDEIRAPFKYKPGDIVRLKVDSSRVLLQDIIVGGDKNNYYVKYRIQNRDRSIEEISPQFVY